MNILQETQKCMHTCIQEIRKQIAKKNKNKSKESSIHLLIDGNYFNPITYLHPDTKKLEVIPYMMVEGGDNKYTCIAAASILAKVERDNYIDHLCVLHPELIEKYSLDTNKGYGAKKHLEGINTYGITEWHRKSFRPCSTFSTF